MVIFEDFNTPDNPVVLENTSLKDAVSRLEKENKTLKSKLKTPKDTEESKN